MSGSLPYFALLGLGLGALAGVEAICTYSPNTVSYPTVLGGEAVDLDVGMCTNPAPSCMGDCVATQDVFPLTYTKATECACASTNTTECDTCHAVPNPQVIGTDAYGNDIIVDVGSCVGTCGSVDMNLTISADDKITGIWVNGVPLTLGPNAGTLMEFDTYLFTMDPSIDNVIAVQFKDVGGHQVGLIAALYAISQLSPTLAAIVPPTWGTGTGYLHQFRTVYTTPAAGWEQPGFNDAGWNDVLQACPDLHPTGYPHPVLPFVEYQAINESNWNYFDVSGTAWMSCNVPSDPNPPHFPIPDIREQFVRWTIPSHELGCGPTAFEEHTISVNRVVDCNCECDPDHVACAHPEYWSAEQCRCVRDRVPFEP